MITLSSTDQELLAAARLVACRWQPYLSSALFALQPVPRPGMGTFAVDARWRLYVDMDQAQEWGVESTAAVLIHETNHVVRGHHQRGRRLGTGDRRQQWHWNLVADAAINDDLVGAGIPLPDPILPEHLGVDPNGTEESMWHQVQRATTHPDQRPLGGSDGCGSGSGGHPHPAELDDTDPEIPGIDDLDAQAVQRDVAHRITQAPPDQPIARGLVTWADGLLRPAVDWRRQLRSTYRGTNRPSTTPEPTWNRPSRRSTGGAFLRPGTKSRPAPRVAVVVDTSASMDQDLMDAALAELNALIHHGGTRRTVVIPCDQRAEAPQLVRRIPELEISRGGRTDLRVGIDAAATLTPRPDVIVVLTDGYTPWPTSAPPSTSVIAVVIDDDIDLPRARGIRAVRVAANR